MACQPNVPDTLSPRRARRRRRRGFLKVVRLGRGHAGTKSWAAPVFGTPASNMAVKYSVAHSAARWSPTPADAKKLGGASAGIGGWTGACATRDSNATPSLGVLCELVC